MKHGAALLLAAGALLAAACDRAPGDPPPGAAAQPGFELYSRYCARCHGDHGRARRAARIAGHAVDLTDPAWRRKADAERIERVVREGKGRMEGLADRLAPEEIRTVASYVLWLSAAAGTVQVDGR